MKTKKQIFGMIKSARITRDSYAIAGQQRYKDICNAQIRALQMVLNYKVAKWYWCVGCQRPHKDLPCPYCGSDMLGLKKSAL